MICKTKSLAILGLILVVFGQSCQSPTIRSGSEPGAGKVTLTLGTPARAVGVDWEGVIDFYTVTLTSQNGFPSVNGSTGSGESTLVLDGIQAGTWDITVEAKASGGTVVAMAQLSNQVLPDTSPIALVVKPLATGTGDYTFTLRFPQPTDPIVGVSAQLYTLAGVAVGAPIDMPSNVFSGPAGGLYSVVLAGSGVAPGSYRLAIRLERAGSTARYLNEAVNIGGGVISDHWIRPDGTVLTSRDLVLADYASSDAILSGITIEVDGVPFPDTFAPADFSYEGDVFSTALTQTVEFTAFQAFPGQTIALSEDSGTTWAPLLSGTTSPTLTLNQGPNELWVRVTAPNGVTTQVYTFTLNKLVLVASLSLSPATMTLVVGGSGLVTPTVFPTEADIPGASYLSSNSAVATVDADGTVHAISAGTAVITGTALDGTGVFDTVVVTVTTPASFTISAPTLGVLGTSTTNPTIGKGGDLPVAIAGSSLAAGSWDWRVDGNTITWSAGHPGPTNFILITSGLAQGKHVVDMSVIENGVLYSGTFTLVIQ